VTHRRHSSGKTILSTILPEGRTSKNRNMGQLLTWIGQRCPHCPTPPLPRLSLVITVHGRNSSTNQCGAQSPCRPRTGSRRPLYVGSSNESSDAAPNRRTTIAGRRIDVKPHQILSRRMPHMPQCIPLPKQEMQDLWEHES
jgi:hypothetical protein